MRQPDNEWERTSSAPNIWLPRRDTRESRDFIHFHKKGPGVYIEPDIRERCNTVVWKVIENYTSSQYQAICMKIKDEWSSRKISCRMSGGQRRKLMLLLKRYDSASHRPVCVVGSSACRAVLDGWQRISKIESNWGSVDWHRCTWIFG